MNTETVPAQVEDLINEYFVLRVGESNFPVPYYRNVKRVRGDLRSLTGKGTPEEIYEETMIYSKLRGVNLSKMSAMETRKFMMEQGIGIDCSGFVSHVLNTWTKSIGKGNLYSNIVFPKASLYRSIIRRFRVFENIGANLLTSDLNTTPVQLSDAKVGDLLRLKGLKHGHHVAIITKIVYENEIPRVITYTHSSENYGDYNGIRSGDVEITDIDKDLKDQLWKEVDEKGVCWTYKQLMREYDDNGLRRPNFFMN